ncbi:MAG TPA: FMN-binding protein, partial [bacterium]|nr:FMN-binding protein [bacterium]
MRYLPLLMFIGLFTGTLPGQETLPEGVDVGPARQLMSFDEGIRELFGTNLQMKRDTLLFTGEALAQVEQKLHTSVWDSSVIVHRIYRDNTLLGYGVITNEYGKYRPITILVGVKPDISVQGVRILVYRENRGGEVRRKRFLHQYRNKTLTDPIRINRDIINISGATISVR